MFKIKLIKEYPFKINVFGYSKINSMVLSVMNKPYKVYCGLKMYLKSSITATSVSRVVIDAVKLITKPRLDAKYQDSKIETRVSSNEKISNDITCDMTINMIIKSREELSDRVISALKIVADPTVGYFKKLYEFDNLTLGELDGLTLADMDYVMMLLADSEKEVI